MMNSKETIKKLVSSLLENGDNHRQRKWTESIAVGSKKFIDRINREFGILAQGRKVFEEDGSFQLREEASTYNSVLDIKKEDIDTKNTYKWDIVI